MTDWIDIRADKKHVAKERAKANDLKKSGWWKQKLVDGICHYCEQEFPSKKLTLDHIVPVSRGGKSTKGNVVTSCFDCNQKKKYKTPVEMLLDDMER